jgi:hypothetical protein
MKAHEQAKKWREGLQLSIADLARLTGFSEISIRWYEVGKTPPRNNKHMAGPMKSGKIPDNIWKRYRNTCAGVESQLRAGKQFNWGE